MKKELEYRIEELKEIINRPYEDPTIVRESEKRLKHLDKLYNALYGIGEFFE